MTTFGFECRSGAVTEQDMVDGGKEFRQGFDAKFFGVHLQGLGDPGDLGEFHAPAAALPQHDAFGRDLECGGNVRLHQVEFLAPMSQLEV